MTRSPDKPSPGVTVDYCSGLTPVRDGQTLTIGREGDLAIDDNPFLHRIFLVVTQHEGFWFISNVGELLSATAFDEQGRMEAFLAPKASLPLVFESTVVAFTAGPTSYELTIHNDGPAFRSPPIRQLEGGETTLGPTRLTRDQRLLLLALAEPRLRGEGRASVLMPSSSIAARRLRWTTTKFNRKLDNVCDKLTKLGVRGLRGDQGDHASNRRSRLVEYAIATRLVDRRDLAYLDELDATDSR